MSHQVYSAIFFLSGMSALIFETLWFRQAGLAFGNSVWSASLILSGFMAGLALGNYAVFHWARKIKDPIKLYIIAEIVIGLSGIWLVASLPFIGIWLQPWLSPLVDQTLILNAIRLVAAFALLLLPTIAMGATLPLMVHALTRQQDSFGWALGKLYGWNTLGAVAGTLLAELVLISVIGVLGSGWFAVICNLVALLLAVRLRSAQHEGVSVNQQPSPSARAASGISAAQWRLLVAAAISGFTLLMLEVVWFRFLQLTYSGTSLIFSIMLASVLAGIALGGMAAGSWYRKRKAKYAETRNIALLSGIVLLLTYVGFDALFTEQIPTTPPALPDFVVYSLFLMFPSSFLSGILFVQLGQLIKEDAEQAMRATGLLTFFNTLGAAVGGFAGGFLFLPWLGMELSFFSAIVLYGLLALMLSLGTPSEGALFSLRGSRVAAVVFLIAIVLFPFGLMDKAFFGTVDQRFADLERIYTQETPTESILYYRNNYHGEADHYVLSTNGHSMSSTSVPSRRYMGSYVYLPKALRPDIDSALLICFGVGNTAHAILANQDIQHLDIVDISRDIVTASQLIYQDRPDWPIADPRAELHIEDGRYYLQTTQRQYDLITAEPPPPVHAGIVNLYSEEYFQLIRERLTQQGIVSYWLPVHVLSETDAGSITRAFCNVFDNCSLWNPSGLDWMLMGSKGDLDPVSAENFSKQWRDPVIRKNLNAVGLEAPETLSAFFMGDSSNLELWFGTYPPLRDNWPHRLSTDASQASLYSQLFAMLMEESAAYQRFIQSPYIRSIWPASMIEPSQPYFEAQRIYKEMLLEEYRQGHHWEQLYWLLTQTNLRALPLWLMGSNMTKLAILSSLPEQDKNQVPILLGRAYQGALNRDFATASESLEKIARRGSSLSQEQLRLYLLFLCMNDETGKAAKVIRAVRANNPDFNLQTDFLNWLDGRFGVLGKA